jgi:hypothetical protein
MSMKQMATFSRALQRMRAAAHLGMGDQWFEANDIGNKGYEEIVEILRASEAGMGVLHDFAQAFTRGMNHAADESDYQKIRQPDGTNIDRATLVREAKEREAALTGWGKHFHKIDPVDSKWFSLFEHELPGVHEAFLATHNWAQGSGAGMLLLGGVPGVGKTHLAKASYAYLASHEREVFYRREVDLISNLQRAISDKNVEAVMDEIQTCPWLIIDDYGAAASGPWGRGQMDAIIDSRWENAGVLRTMLTTNLDADGMKAQSPRIWSRLSDRTRAKRVSMKGAEDYREKRGS